MELLLLAIHSEYAHHSLELLYRLLLSVALDENIAFTLIILFQEISSNTIPWKSKLNPELKKEVVKWQQSIVHLKKIKISRWTNP